MVQLIIANNPTRTAILGEAENEADANALLAKLNEPAISLSKQAFPGDLTKAQLAAIYNALVPADQATQRFSSRAAGVKRILAAWEEWKKAHPEQGAAEPPKKGRRGRVAMPISGTIKMIPFTHHKRWQKGSLRSQAYAWLEKNDEVTVEAAIGHIAEMLKINRKQVQGLLSKLVGVKALKFVEGK